jgi:hypothetical protein
VTAVEAHPRTDARLLENVRRNPLVRFDTVHAAVASAPGALTLDALVAQRGLEPDLVKIDVEGFEPDVLAGGRGTLTERRPAIVLEWTPE